MSVDTHQDLAARNAASMPEHVAHLPPGIREKHEDFYKRVAAFKGQEDQETAQRTAETRTAEFVNQQRGSIPQHVPSAGPNQAGLDALNAQLQADKGRRYFTDPAFRARVDQIRTALHEGRDFVRDANGQPVKGADGWAQIAEPAKPELAADVPKGPDGQAATAGDAFVTVGDVKFFPGGDYVVSDPSHEAFATVAAVATEHSIPQAAMNDFAALAAEIANTADDGVELTDLGPTCQVSGYTIVAPPGYQVSPSDPVIVVGAQIAREYGLSNDVANALLAALVAGEDAYEARTEGAAP